MPKCCDQAAVATLPHDDTANHVGEKRLQALARCGQLIHLLAVLLLEPLEIAVEDLADERVFVGKPPIDRTDRAAGSWATSSIVQASASSRRSRASAVSSSSLGLRPIASIEGRAIGRADERIAALKV